MDVFGHWFHVGTSLIILAWFSVCAIRSAVSGPRRTLHVYVPAAVGAGISVASYFWPHPPPGPWTPAVYKSLLHLPGALILVTLACAVYAVVADMRMKSSRTKTKGIGVEAV